MGDAERAERAAQQTAGRLARKMRDIAGTAKQTRSQGLVVPILDADPPVGDPTTLWGFDDGRLRLRGTDGTIHTHWPGFQYLTLDADPAPETGIDFYRNRVTSQWNLRRPDGSWERYAPVAAADGGSKDDPGGSTTKPKQDDPKTRKYRRDYSATWSRTLCPVHGPETGSTLYYGRYSGTHGRRRIMLGLNDSAIRDDLAGSVVRECYFRMRNAHAYANSGIEVHFGGHNKSAAPGSYSSVRERVFRGHWPKVGFGQEWRRVPVWFGEALRDNRIKGITINQPSDSIAYYGAMDPGSFELRVVYTR